MALAPPHINVCSLPLGFGISTYSTSFKASEKSALPNLRQVDHLPMIWHAPAKAKMLPPPWLGPHTHHLGLSTSPQNRMHLSNRMHLIKDSLSIWNDIKIYKNDINTLHKLFVKLAFHPKAIEPGPSSGQWWRESHLCWSGRCHQSWRTSCHRLQPSPPGRIDCHCYKVLPLGLY